MEGSCHRPFAHHPHASLGNAGRTALPHVMQLYGSECGGPTREPADHHREAHQGLRAVNQAIPLGHDDPLQGYPSATNPPRFLTRR